MFGAEAIINELSTALFAMMLRAHIETQALPAGALALLTSTPMRAALQAISRWRTRAADPLADPSVVEVWDTAIRCCETMYAAIVRREH